MLPSVGNHENTFSSSFEFCVLKQNGVYIYVTYITNRIVSSLVALENRNGGLSIYNRLVKVLIFSNYFPGEYETNDDR